MDSIRIERLKAIQNLEIVMAVYLSTSMVASLG